MTVPVVDVKRAVDIALTAPAHDAPTSKWTAWQRALSDDDTACLWANCVYICERATDTGMLDEATRNAYLIGRACVAVTVLRAMASIAADVLSYRDVP